MGKSYVRLAFVLLLVLGSACNTLPSRPPMKWAALVDRNLPGVWTSDKFGRLLISCDGYIHMDDQGGFDLGNTGLKNAKIVEIKEADLLIETLPLVKDHYRMEQYPHQVKGAYQMKFWGREWKQVEAMDCSGRASY